MHCSLIICNQAINATVLLRSYLCQCQYKALPIFKRPLTIPWQNLCSTITFVLFRSAFFLESADSPIAPKAVWRFCIDYIQLWAVVVCKLPSCTKVQSCPPTSSLQLLKTLFGSQVLVFLRGESQESLECHMVSPKSLSPCPPPHVGTQAPKLGPSALVHCAICWWVHNQTLQM